MKHKKLLITATLCLSLGATFAFTQPVSTEGISRQISAMRSMLKSLADDIQPRIATLETQVSELIDRENLRTICNNQEGDTSLYWPLHPEADSEGCVSHTDLTTTISAGGCTNHTVSWATQHNTCAAMAPPTPDGVDVTVSKSIPYCDQGYVGTATYRCEAGSFVLVSGSCSYQNNHNDCR